MAIGMTPLFSQLSGSVAGINFRTRRNLKIEISKKRIPYQPQRSAAQQETNTKYAAAVQSWRTATDDQRATWDELGDLENISGFNWLVRESFAVVKARYGTAKYGTAKYSTEA